MIRPKPRRRRRGRLRARLPPPQGRLCWRPDPAGRWHLHGAFKILILNELKNARNARCCCCSAQYAVLVQRHNVLLGSGRGEGHLVRQIAVSCVVSARDGKGLEESAHPAAEWPAARYCCLFTGTHRYMSVRQKCSKKRLLCGKFSLGCVPFCMRTYCEQGTSASQYR